MIKACNSMAAGCSARFWNCRWD